MAAENIILSFFVAEDLILRQGEWYTVFWSITRIYDGFCMGVRNENAGGILEF